MKAGTITMPNGILLDPRKVRQIRRARAQGITYAELGRRFDVTPEAARAAASGRSWSWVR